MPKRILHIVLLLFALKAKSQYVTVEDTAFAHYLGKIDRTLMNYDCTKLDTVAASNFTGMIYCDSEKVQSIKEIVYFKKLQSLNAYSNEIKEFPNMSTLTNLERLNLSYNQLQNASSIATLKDIDRINLSNNSLRSFPNISGFRELQTVNLTYNHLSFKDFIPLSAAINFKTVFQIVPQKKLTSDTSITVREKTRYTLKVAIDEGISGLTYAWYRNGSLITTTTNNTLFFNPISLTDSGTYTVNVTSSNSTLSGVVINSGQIKLQVEPCLQILNYELASNSDCESSAATLKTLHLSDYSTPYSCHLINTVSSEKTELPWGPPVAVKEGTFNLRVTNINGCYDEKQNALQVTKSKGCPTVFTPNGDNMQDEYFADGTGEAEIVNKDGKIIRRITLPFYWNGTDSQGTEAPLGTYIIVHKSGNSEKVTLLR